MKDGAFGLSALAAARKRKMMEPFLLTPPLKSAPRASHAARKCCLSSADVSPSSSMGRSFPRQG